MIIPYFTGYNRTRRHEPSRPVGEHASGPVGMNISILSESLGTMSGVGERRAEVLAEHGVATVRDLLHYFPRRYLDRSTTTRISELSADSGAVTVVARVRSVRVVDSRKQRLDVTLEDDSGTMKAVWFRGVRWIHRMISANDRVAFHGKPQEYRGRYSFTHPDFDVLDGDSAALETGRIVALYPGGAALERVGLNSRSFRRLIYALFKNRGLEIPELLPDTMRERFNLIDGRVALRAVHFPRSQAELDEARRRLKFEEFLFVQMMLAATRQTRSAVEGPEFTRPDDADDSLLHRFVRDVLPFELTEGQKTAIEDVIRDTSGGRRMNRLVQGDVGSGKTVVAVSAMLHALDNGFQSSFMAPTEILAEQHARNLRSYLEPLGVQMRLLLGGQSKALRREILEDVRSGNASVVVGTHAVIEDTVEFRNLGIAVVDEQHRFGVMQRAKMFEKGDHPHMLLMTATPIPRSLAMTVYGDLDVTLIKERPAGRKEIKTQRYFEKDREEVYGFVREQLREGRQAYVVYPLVEESEKVDLKDAESGFERLSEQFRPYRVDLVHGRMLPYEKDEAMDRFKSGASDILVATTVIEVGVDIPNATIMLIEHAGRFGLTQLHQLRGRVGRGAAQSYCILMTDHKNTAEAEERLKAMVATNDGFKISEYDLKLRGAGDFFGTRQSGLPDLKIADIVADAEILVEARQAALDLVRKDPHLEAAENQVIARYYESFYQGESLGFVRVG